MSASNNATLEELQRQLEHWEDEHRRKKEEVLKRAIEEKELRESIEKLKAEKERQDEEVRYRMMRIRRMTNFE
jgi:hypothetical protein